MRRLRFWPRAPMEPTAPLARRRLHRATFLAAGVYNLAWGALTVLDPQGLFRWADMEPMRHPAVFACLGMAIGLYGLVYAEIARRPERGFLLAAVGLTGKILGPIGWVVQVTQHGWPLSTGVLIVFNDLVWWVPFGLYLWDAWPSYRRDLQAGW